jgi:LacI family transcriptional regulator
MATIYEVSELAGVSLATVSRVINGSGKVSDKTRRKELQIVALGVDDPNDEAQAFDED